MFSFDVELRWIRLTAGIGDQVISFFLFYGPYGLDGDVIEFDFIFGNTFDTFWCRE